MVALVLGIVTDYAVFFLTAMRNRLLLEGEEKVDAATKATAEYFPTVLTAGLIVAAGTVAASRRARSTSSRRSAPPWQAR